MTHYPLVGDVAEAIALASGAKASLFAVVRSVERRQTSQGRPFVDLVVADLGGSVSGKIWDEAQGALDAAAEMRPGQAVKIAFEAASYRGAPQLKVLELRAAADDDEGFVPDRLFGEVPDWIPELACRTLVFDIETVPDTGIREMPPTIVKSLTEYAKRKDIDESIVRGLSPFFAKIVSLAFGDGEDADAPIHALVVPRDDDDTGALPDWARPVDEAELLRSFWTLAAAAETVVTYNGRGFDVPFLVARSLVHDIPARVDLVSNRFSLRPHLDLYEILGQRGRGPSNLDVVCWALGIESPKGTMDGSMVAPAYESGRLPDIAEYNRHDVRATAAIYRRVRHLVLKHRNDWS